MVEAYAFCNIPPHQIYDYTPEELAFMIRVRKIQLGIEQPPAEMTNPEMQAVAETIVETMKHRPERGVR